jgi:hypothetical protein
MITQKEAEAALKHVRNLLDEFDQFGWDYGPCPSFQLSRIITKQLVVIERLTSYGSVYRKNANSALSRWGASNKFTASRLIGIIEAIVEDYEAGVLKTMEELIHADVFHDFLEMANYLLGEGYKDAAAVITGSVLEEHLRQLCIKSGNVSAGNNHPKKADTMNSDLRALEVYGKLDQKNVTAWLDLRNQAAHGRYEKYTPRQVAVMLEGIRNFVSRNPA